MHTRTNTHTKRQRNCGPGCLCQGCTNISIPEAPDNSDGESNEDSESSYLESEGEDSELVEEVMTDDNLLTHIMILYEYKLYGVVFILSYVNCSITLVQNKLMFYHQKPGTMSAKLL